MKQKLVYEEVERLPIRSLSVVGDFNDWKKDVHFFARNEEGQWEIEVDFPAGQNLYKLVINGEMTLNDPTFCHRPRGKYMDMEYRSKAS